jgi:hypothetical protein
MQEVKDLVAIGMSREDVQGVLGEPSFAKELADALSSLEVWRYNCRDGIVQITMRDGKVTTIK